jgi:hypothetical protein
MDVQNAHQMQKKQQIDRQATPAQEEIPASPAPTHTDGIVVLQRLIGNSGVKQLLAQRKTQHQPVGLPPLMGVPQPQVQRQCTDGSCNGQHDEENDQPSADSTVQRALEDEETVKDIPDIRAGCQTEEEGVGFGSGSGRTIHLHGRTDANYNHGQPVPEPFPDTVEVTTGEIRGTQVFSAHGTFEANFEADPDPTLPPVPDGLTPCQQAAVRRFIDGPLAEHEQEHVNAFNDNYDGTPTLSVDFDNIPNTHENRRRAMERPVEIEDQRRVTAANQASRDLDPWNRTIPGLDCEEDE